MARLDVERENKLQPQRMDTTKRKLEKLGYSVRAVDHSQLEITLDNGSIVKFWPYSGWHSGKDIVDGRGFDRLLKELKEARKGGMLHDEPRGDEPQPVEPHDNKQDIVKALLWTYAIAVTAAILISVAITLLAPKATAPIKTTSVACPVPYRLDYCAAHPDEVRR